MLSVINDLNHVGVAASYERTWQHLETMAKEQSKIKEMCQTNIIWVYDNLNISKHVGHQRIGKTI